MARAAIKRLMGEYQAMMKEEDRVGDVFARPLDENIFEWHFTITGPTRHSDPQSGNASSKAQPAAAAPAAAAPSAGGGGTGCGQTSLGAASEGTPSTHADRDRTSCDRTDADMKKPADTVGGDDDDDEEEEVGSTPYRHGLYHGRLIFPRTYPLEPPDIIFLTPSGRFVTREKICSSISSFHKESWRPSYDIRFTLLSLRLFMAQEDEQGVGAIPRHAFSVEAKQRLARESWNFVCPECRAHDASEGPDSHAQAAVPWTVRTLYTKEMKPYRETSLVPKAEPTLPPPPPSSSSSSPSTAPAPAAPLAAPTGHSEVVVPAHTAHTALSDAPDLLCEPPQALTEQDGEVPPERVAHASASPPTAPLPVPAAQDVVVVVHIHHLVYALSTRLLWRVVMICGGLVTLILARRSVASLCIAWLD